MWFQVFLTLVVHMTVPCYLQHVVSHDPDSGDERDYDVLPEMWFQVFLTLVVHKTVTCYL